MAPGKISMGEVYSENDLNELRIYPTGNYIEKIDSVICPIWHLERNCSEFDYNCPEFEIGGSYLKPRKKDNKNKITETILMGNLEDNLEIYANHSKMYLVEKYGDERIIHFAYNPLGTIMLDECTREKKRGVDIGLAKKGFVGFRMKNTTEDPEILQITLNMNIIGIITYDKIFGLDNRLKRNKYVEDSLRDRLLEDYKKIEPAAKIKSIVFERGVNSKIINKKLNKLIKERTYKSASAY